jgi:hypothetical protein
MWLGEGTGDTLLLLYPVTDLYNTLNKSGKKMLEGKIC